MPIIKITFELRSRRALGGGQGRGDDPRDGGGLGSAIGVGEQQVRGADHGGGERGDIGVGRDAAQVALGFEIAGDHCGGLGDERDARPGGGPQPGAQFVTRDDQADEREDRRAEQARERGGQVARDGAAPRHGAQGRRLGADPCGAVTCELGEERVEVGEVPVQHSLGYPRFRGDGAAGQAVRAVPEQDTLGGVEELTARVADGNPCRHWPSVLPSPSANASVNGRAPIYSGRMTTLPSESGGPPGSGGTVKAGAGGYDQARELHLQRQVAEGFGAVAARYDRSRPAYPAGLVDRLIAASPG